MRPPEPARALRTGFTTGTCAAAAARAAARLYFTGEFPERVAVILPEGQTASFAVLPGEDGFADFCRVQKDAGDDPDVTNGSWVYARVSPLTEAQLLERRAGGTGYFLEEYPSLYLDGGPGIGIAKKPGLSCPVGHYAINPVPRAMILKEVRDVRRFLGRDDRLLVEIAIPAGEQLAKKTFNPRLGVAGGISVLGTTGIVRPMSEDALLETIALDLHQKKLAHPGLVVMTPGNYGERFLSARFGFPPGEAVVCSNYAAASMEFAAREGVKRLLFVAHIGKLIKIAAGMPNTHSRYGDRRMETMALLLGELSAGEDCRRAVLAANTTEEALGILKPLPAPRGGTSLAEALLGAAAGRAARYLSGWGGGSAEVFCVTFSSEHGLTGASRPAEEIVRLIADSGYRNDGAEEQPSGSSAPGAGGAKEAETDRRKEP